MYKEIIQSNLRVIYEREPTFKASIDAAFHEGMSYTEALEVAVVNLSSVVARQNDKAIQVAVKYGGIDGAHHKDWVIDQMVRSLMFSREQLKAAEAPQELIEHFRQNGKSFEYSDENGTVSGWVVGDRILIKNITVNAGNN